MAAKSTSLKDRLYAWAGRNNYVLSYNTGKMDESGQHQSILTIGGIEHRAKGEGPKKKDAEEKAAEDFVAHLKKCGLWEEKPSDKKRVKMLRGGKDAKSYLNELVQRNIIPPFEYLPESSELEGVVTYRCKVDIIFEGRTVSCVGEGRSKQGAKTACAMEVIKEYQKLGVIDQDPPFCEQKGAQPDAPPQMQQSVESALSTSNQSGPAAGAELANELSRLTLAGGPRTAEGGAVGGQLPSPAVASRSLSTPETAAGDASFPWAVNAILRLPGGPELLRSVSSQPSDGVRINFNAPISIGSIFRSDGFGNSMRPMSSETGTKETHSSASGTEKEPPLELSGLFENDEVVTDRDVLEISRNIGQNRKTIGEDLGLTSTQVENCAYREEDPYQVNRNIIGKWRETMASRATISTISTVLWQNGAHDAVRALARLRGLSK